jgi:hypothetical protein
MNGRRIGLIVLVIALVAAGVVVTRVVTQSDQEDIYLEGVGDTGADPFTTIAIVTPTTTTTTTSIPPASTTTALFGGSGDQKVCYKAALLAFLVSHPDKGQAWVDAQNADPTLQWSGSPAKLTLENLPAYFDELTPTFLAVDTRVTNHSFVNGKAVPHQSILQAGTAVLVDKAGIPRARCACGNPLIPPHKVRDPHYKGHCWPGCHDRPPCSPPGCTETTTTTVPDTTTVPSSTTTTCQSTAGAAGCGPPPQRTTLKPTTTVTRPPTTPAPTTTTTIGRTTTTTIPSTQTTQGGKP